MDLMAEAASKAIDLPSDGGVVDTTLRESVLLALIS
jgi:hypothetical protein